MSISLLLLTSVLSIFTALVKIKFLFMVFFFLSVYEFTVWVGIQRSEDSFSCCSSITFHLFSLGSGFPCSWNFAKQVRLVVGWALGNRLSLLSSLHCRWAAPCLAYVGSRDLTYLVLKACFLDWAISPIPLCGFLMNIAWFSYFTCSIRFFLFDLTWTLECRRKKGASVLAIPS